MRDHVGITLISFAASLAALDAAVAGTPPPVRIRVVTLNVLAGVGAPGSANAIALGKFLTVLDEDGPGPNTGLVPDVVLLQECAQGATSDLINFRNTYLPGYTFQTATGDGFNFNATLYRPGITLVSHTSLSVGGPRGVGKTRLRIPGALRDVIFYNAHFKSGSASSDQQQRTTNATNCGNNVSFEWNNNNVNIIFGGDLNSNNNNDGTITNLFFTSLGPPPVSSGILNLAVETLAGAANPNVTIHVTFPSSGSRLDYICLDHELASFFDADMNGSYSQDERNQMGFVYYSNEDGGQQSNGSTTATNTTSDHRPVVFDVLLPRDPMAPYYPPEDVDRSGSVTIEDLYQWENGFALTAPPAPSPAPDIDGNRNVDLNDRAVIRTALRAGEAADIAIH